MLHTFIDMETICNNCTVTKYFGNHANSRTINRLEGNLSLEQLITTIQQNIKSNQSQRFCPLGRSAIIPLSHLSPPPPAEKDLQKTRLFQCF